MPIWVPMLLWLECVLVLVQITKICGSFWFLVHYA